MGVGAWPVVTSRSPALQVLVMPHLKDSLQCAAHLLKGLFKPPSL